MRESLEPLEVREVVRVISLDWGFGCARRGDGPAFIDLVIVWMGRDC